MKALLAFALIVLLIAFIGACWDRNRTLRQESASRRVTDPSVESGRLPAFASADSPHAPEVDSAN